MIPAPRAPKPRSAARAFGVVGQGWIGVDEDVEAAFEPPQAPADRADRQARGGADFGLSGVFGLLAKEDLYRSLDLAKSFKGEAARATATLAIVNQLLE